MLRPAVEQQIHHQESHVGHGIGITEALVELDAIDDHQLVLGRRLWEHVDMIQVQVAMRVPDHAGRGTLFDQGT